jgi:hypothetical protein
MPDKRKSWYFRRFGKLERRGDNAYKQIESALPTETVTDDYGTRPKWNDEIEAIYQRMPNDSRRLHPGELRWQVLLAPKYIRNRVALARFLALARESDAGDAYLYYPLGANKPVVWFRDNRYTLEDFESRYGQE